MNKQVGIIFLILIFSLVFSSCTDEADSKKENTQFQRQELLNNMANNLIIPSYNEVILTSIELNQSIASFSNSPNQASLEQARKAWKKAAFAWQFASNFNIGPAAEMGIQKTLSEEIAIFPISKDKIENFILAQDTSFNNFDRDSRGLFGIEYLLFDENVSDAQVIKKFTNSLWRKNYAQASSHQFLNRVSTVRIEWNAYLPIFIAQNGTDIGSSTSYLYNEFLKSFEGLKNFKFGIPLGRRPGQSSTLPQTVEACYSGYSTELAKQHWKSIQYIWDGKDVNGMAGIGFKEYLESVEGGSDLILLTQQQMVNVQVTFDALPDGSLSDAIEQQFAKPDAVHTELQKLTRFFKSDLSSLIGVAVTYSSGDGD